MKKIEESEDRYLSSAFLRRKKRVVLQIGEKEIKANQLVKLLAGKNYTFHAVSRLNSALQKVNRMGCSNILDLARNITLDDLIDAGCGEASIEVWGFLLRAKGRNPLRWLNCDVKFQSRAQARRRK